jgi:thiol-disulfide isomerase/thioredoxin
MKFARAAAWFTLSLGGFLICGCPNGMQSRSGGSGPVLGSEPPEVSAAEWLNTDTPQTLAGLRGKVVLVEFWATSCGPCVAGIPHMNELQAKYADKGLQVLSFTDDDQRTVEAFQKKAKAPIEYPIGTGTRLADKYGVSGIPHAFLVGRDGKLVWEGHPADPACERNLVAALQ